MQNRQGRSGFTGRDWLPVDGRSSAGSFRRGVRPAQPALRSHGRGVMLTAEMKAWLAWDLGERRPEP
jgi:hypothetical protein